MPDPTTRGVTDTVDWYLRNWRPKTASGGATAWEADTAHPTGKLDGGLMPVEEGQPSRDWDRALAGRPGVGKLTVPAQPPAKPVGDPSGAAMGVSQDGLSREPVGKDPANETAPMTPPPDKPVGGPTASPLTTDIGPKYAALSDAELDAEVDARGDELAAFILGHPKQAGAAPAAQADEEFDKLAAAMGWELAGLYTGRASEADVEAAVASDLAGVVKQAEDMADLAYGELLDQRRRLKAAGEGEGPPHKQDETPGETPGEMPGEMPGGPEAGPMVTPEELLAGGGDAPDGGESDPLAELSPEQIQQLIEELKKLPELQHDGGPDGAGPMPGPTPDGKTAAHRGRPAAKTAAAPRPQLKIARTRTLVRELLAKCAR